MNFNLEKEGIHKWSSVCGCQHVRVESKIMLLKCPLTALSPELVGYICLASTACQIVLPKLPSRCTTSFKGTLAPRRSAGMHHV